METTIRKFGDSIGVIIPKEFQARVGEKYQIHKIADTFVLTPVHKDLFADETKWYGFRDSITERDREWDESALL
ncbi:MULTISPECIES: AbrB/MazE/SpoVT family DNA-binding domain-containing protein [Lacticaseibacillus]|uniref:SpoVT-AbrB domain-containing protein n=1 Tax=Lacticaseibacillus casei DSM 20011 = JCM 1134 = ATCC 393 TaxID=1423732 RepID=A0AAD1AN42_LACCA|nr:hypothetical protein [Lacticaseibacillus casei]MBI6597741.1 antitoxin MazE [Lacticaseibacillus casei]MBO1481448.1 antitoxin MazE [Lacticaseibacillus casei]MBO2416728.1 antitoxin MazE [Lacticaseibacillus casei]MCK2081165.1 antitoxin MazE [Lacticaseibacillus casei]MDZ5495765.1 antitoxin MazE [Lacticaseibacillus casei]